MGLMSWIKTLAGKRNTDRMLDLFQHWSGSSGSGIGVPWTGNRAEQAAHFRGWNYVAVRAICEEIACMPPQVHRIRSKEELDRERTKALKAGQPYRAKTLSRRLRTKALAHIQDSDELEPVDSDHPLVRLLQNPNGPDVAWTFFYKLALYMELTGNTYVYVAENNYGEPAQLWVIPSQWVYDQPGDNELIGSYLIRPTLGIVPAETGSLFGAGWFPGMGGSNRIDAKHIIKIAYPNPLSIVDGYSPVGATGDWNDVSEYIDRARVQCFYNGSYPGVVVVVDKEFKGAIDPEDMKRYAAKLDEKYAGVKNTGRTAILAPGMTIQSFRQTAVEMDYTASGSQMSDWQLAARRVPKSMVGLNEQESYASMIATKAGFYQGTIKPKLTLIGQVFTEKLAKRYDDSLCIQWADPTPEDPQQKLTQWQGMYDRGVVTDNEFREEFGLPKFEFGGNDPEKPAGKIVVPYATGVDPQEEIMNQMSQGQKMPPGMGEDDGGIDALMQEALGGAGGDGAKETEKPGIPTPIAKRINGHAKGVVNVG